MFHATVLPQKYQYFWKVYIYFYVIYIAHSPVILNIWWNDQDMYCIRIILQQQLTTPKTNKMEAQLSYIQMKRIIMYIQLHIYLLEFLFRKLLKTCLCATAFQLCFLCPSWEGQIKSGGNETKYDNDYNEGGLRVNAQKSSLLYSAQCRTNF